MTLRPTIMISMQCELAADTKIETPEGALTVKSVAGKAVAVFTRDDGGRTRFRMIHDARKIADRQPVLTITLENGLAFRVGVAQVLYNRGMEEARADVLIAGDELEPAFHFPSGYRFHDDTHDCERESSRSWRVARVEPGGDADLYCFGVHKAANFFLSAGVLAKADGGGERC